MLIPNKKAQIEIIGLVIIIILIITLGFIILAFSGTSQSNVNLDQSTTDLLQAIKKTQTPQGPMQELIVEAQDNKEKQQFLKQELTKILKLQRKQYGLTIKVEQETILILNPQDFGPKPCTEYITDSTTFYKKRANCKILIIQCE